MSKVSIPLRVDPRKMADRAAVLEGEQALVDLTRLCEALERTEGSVRLRFSFGRDEQKTVVVRTELEVRVSMVCQRCLELVELPIHSACEYAVVNVDANVQHLPKGYDVLELGEDPLDLLALVEDELLLALPIVPLHAPEDCQTPNAGASAAETPQEDAAQLNPFHVLAQLKRDPNV